MNPMKRISCGAIVIAGLVLAACGGGGGGVVDLSPPVYSIGGTVTGLGAGKTVVLRNNGGNDLTVGADGTFAFTTALNNTAAYSVAIATQPVGQICTIGFASGTVRGADITNVAVTCASNAYTIGGTVTGLVTGRTVVLRNNGGNDLTVSANTNFTFTAPVASGATYSVTIATQPVAQTCSVSNASGTVGAVIVTNVSVSCASIAPGAPIVTLGFGVKELRFSWAAVGGATFYRVFESPEVGLGYTQLGPDLTTLLPTMNFNHTIPVHRRLGARYYVDACNAIGCTPSA
ncbi:MAG: hypothetical protein ACKVQT_37775, partial [Burkholderiales bacterium]